MGIEDVWLCGVILDMYAFRIENYCSKQFTPYDT